MVGQLLVALYAPAAAVLIASATSRVATRRAAWLGLVIYLTTPWIFRIGVIAYVEGPLCFYHAALIWGVIRGWTEPRDTRSSWWLLLGLLAGGAHGLQVPGFDLGCHPPGPVRGR